MKLQPLHVYLRCYYHVGGNLHSVWDFCMAFGACLKLLTMQVCCNAIGVLHCVVSLQSDVNEVSKSE